MPPLFLTPKLILLMCSIIVCALVLVHYLHIKNKSHLSWLTTTIMGIMIPILLSLFFANFPFPNPYLPKVYLWRQVSIAVILIFMLQYLYIFPSPVPYLNEARVINRLLRIFALTLSVMAFIVTAWGTIAQIIWLERAVIFLILLVIVGGV